MSVTEIQEYTATVCRSGLLTSEQMRDQYDSFCQCDDYVEYLEQPLAFAKYLESRGLLTRWQNSNLLQGRSKGFVVGKFRVLKLIGAGGMGRVYLAEDQMLERKVALKVLPRKASKRESTLKRFLQEAKALAKLNHDNIVRVHEIDVRDDTHFIVMEFIQGRDLQHKVMDQGPLSEADAIEYTRQAALGLSHAHEAGLIHRDVKPANMLLDGKGTVKLLDLGLALLQDNEGGALTNDPTKALGTADYISPEQALNCHEIDSRTDLYSLGCSLYFFLSGQAPFCEGTVAQRLMAHQTVEPKSINTIRSEKNVEPVSDATMGVCRRLMAKIPDDRFGTAMLAAQGLALLQSDSVRRGVSGSAVSVANAMASFDPSSEGSARNLDTLAMGKSVTVSEHSVTTRGGVGASRRRSGRRNSWLLTGLVAATVLSVVGLALVVTSQRGGGGEGEGVSDTSAVGVVSENEAEKYFIVGRGTRYHREICTFVTNAKSKVRQVADDLIAEMGLLPCKTCLKDHQP